MRFRASNVALFLHLKSVWPDWAIFKGFGNKFSFKSSPNIIKLFWKHITFSVKTSPGYDLATFSEFGYFSSNIWSHCLLFESRQSIMGFIIFFEHFSTNFIFSFWKDKNVWKRHNNKKTQFCQNFFFRIFCRRVWRKLSCAKGTPKHRPWRTSSSASRPRSPASIAAPTWPTRPSASFRRWEMRGLEKFDFYHRLCNTSWDEQVTYSHPYSTKS